MGGRGGVCEGGGEAGGDGGREGGVVPPKVEHIGFFQAKINVVFYQNELVSCWVFVKI